MTASASAAATPMPTAAPSPTAAPLDPFLQACFDRVGYLDQLAWLMLWAALILAVVAGGVVLYVSIKEATKKPETKPKSQAGLEGIPLPALEPLAKLLETLAKLPVWFSLFLAGLALAWFASSISDGRCGNAPEAAAPVKQEAGAPDKGAADKAAAKKPAVEEPTASLSPAQASPT